MQKANPNHVHVHSGSVFSEHTAIKLLFAVDISSSHVASLVLAHLVNPLIELATSWRCVKADDVLLSMMVSLRF